MSLEVRGYERYITPLSLNDPTRRWHRWPCDNRSLLQRTQARCGLARSPKTTAGVNRLPGCLTPCPKDKIFLDF